MQFNLLHDSHSYLKNVPLEHQFIPCFCQRIRIASPLYLSLILTIKTFQKKFESHNAKTTRILRFLLSTRRFSNDFQFAIWIFESNCLWVHFDVFKILHVAPVKHRSCSREQKLKTIGWYYVDIKRASATSREFTINRGKLLTGQRKKKKFVNKAKSQNWFVWEKYINFFLKRIPMKSFWK